MTTSRQIGLRIAGIDFTMEGPERSFEEMCTAWSGFLTEPAANPTAEIVVQRVNGEVGATQTSAPPAATIGSGQLHLTHGDLFDLTLDLTSRRGALKYRRWPPDDTLGLVPAGLRGSMVALCASILPRVGGCLVHAAALNLDGRGVAFLGPSGAGKSTLCSMFGDATVLSDELVAVTDAATTPRVHATPFSKSRAAGRSDNDVSLCLASSLRKAPAARFLFLSAVAAFRLLARCTAVCTGDTEGEQLAFGAIDHLAESIPWRTLEFPKETIPTRRAVLAALAEAAGR